MPRKDHTRHIRRSRLAAEYLESRLLLTADLTAATRREIVWNGQSIAVQADSWIVTTGDPATPPAVRGGWAASPLGEGCYAVRAPGVSPAEFGAWAGAAGVRSYEPDRIITASALPNDSSFGSLWGLNNTGQSGGVVDADIDAVEAWDVTTGSRSVVVAVVDTGIDYNHPDLAANMWRNPREVAGDRIDNDGNGFVDDIFGWDFASNDPDPFDDNSHGTHVAGTIGAVGNNGTGVAGVNWQVSLMALKFLGADGSGATSAAIAALNYATTMRRTFGVNVVATNNSWGGGGASTSLTNAIVAGGNAGILCIAAAGNESANNDVTPSYPANVASDAVISVAATDSFNRLASFSNYGATTVDVAAPGVSIRSTTPGSTYSSYSGTSMASPHVAGLVGLMAAANPQATAAEIRSAILSTAVPVSGLAGKVATGGLINAAAAVAAIRGTTPPPPPAVAPVADVVDVSPDPRTTAVSGVVVQFDRAVSGVDLGDFRLTRDGAAVSLAGAAVTTTDNVRWTISNLTAATTSTGTYVLTLNASGSGIVATDTGTALATSVSDTWLTQSATLVDAGDTIAAAATVIPGSGGLRLSGRIGDGLYAARDVDIYKVTLAAGQSLTVDIDARSLSGGSTLDSYLRVFNASGKQLTWNDDDGVSYDSRLTYRASSAGTYYVGVSGFGNSGYSPTRAGSGRNGSTGVYQVLFSASALAASSGARVAGFRDSGIATLASDAAFAAYGANWVAALPSLTATGRARRAGC
jgi:subtilisin family serine protease